MTAAELHELDLLLAYLQRAHGVDLMGYKRTSLSRRMYRRVERLGLSSLTEYTMHIESHPGELSMLRDTLLINTTGFFRDPAAWDVLNAHVFSRLKSRNGQLRIWSAGCASGEEVWSTAILLSEALGEERYRRQVTIHATDLDPDALARLRAGRYTALDLANVPAPFRSKYFESCDDGFVVCDSLRASVVVSCHDLIRDPPIGWLDLVICRNTMIYFTVGTTMALLSRFYSALNDGGHLFLGAAELPLTHVRLFEPVDSRAHIYSRIPRALFRPASRDHLETVHVRAGTVF